MKKNLKVDEKGYQKLFKELTKQEELLHNLRFKNSQDKFKINRWYEDAGNYQQHLEEQVILKKINMLKEQIKCAKIISVIGESNKVDLDDIIKVDIFNEGDTREEMLIRLVGGLGNFSVEPLEISINSPLGDAIYNKSLGEMTKYKVENSWFSVKIKEKLN